MNVGAELPITIGTAGHVDHGKTTLVKALTGTDTDRLAEEKRRGLTIELGFAELELPGGRRVSLIDVPGHERFVRTMVAGASGIGMYLMVVAADDGIMPQTREHWVILRALGIKRGVVAITKQDAVAQERLDEVIDDVHKLTGEVSVVPVCALERVGIPELLASIEAVAAQAADQLEEEVKLWYDPGPVLHVDRAFTMKGAGTVVTGTLTSGALAKDARLKILPAGVSARVRNLQVHGSQRETAEPGRRVALNLAGIKRTEVARGDAIVDPSSSLTPTYRLDVRVAVADENPAEWGRVQVHHGTRDTAARAIVLDNDRRYAQLRLETQMLAMPGDRLVVRRISPPETLGGAIVIDPQPARHGPGHASERLALLSSGKPTSLIEQALAEPDSESLPLDPAAWINSRLLGPALHRFSQAEWRRAVDDLLASEDVKPTPNGRLRAANGDSARPMKRTAAGATPSRDAVRLLALLQADAYQPRSPVALAAELNLDRRDVETRLHVLTSIEDITRLADNVYYPTDVLAELTGIILGILADHGSITIAGLRDHLDISRKYSQALLEHLDHTGVTVRRGDAHVLRGRPRPHMLGAGRQESGGSTGLQSQ